MSRAVVAAFVGLAFLVPAAAASPDAEVGRQIDRLRGIEPTEDEVKLRELNARMDSVWRYLGENRAAALPIVKRALAQEIATGARDQFFVLDLAALLVAQRAPDSTDTVVAALQAINPDARIIQYNFRQLVQFAHAVAKTGDPRVLPQLDRIFLPNERRFEHFLPPHVVRLDGFEIAVLLYGVSSLHVEQHIAARLLEPAYAPHRIRLLELLTVLGSARSTPAIVEVLRDAEDHRTASVAINALLSLGGPAGRAAVLAYEPRRPAPETVAHLDQIRPQVEKASFETLSEAARRADGPAPNVADAELRQRLKRMYDNYGVDNETNPSNLLTSGIPADELLEQLVRIRWRMMHRLSNHAFEDLMVTNHLINTLQYKAASGGKALER